ncbi:hypothetical protein SDC9_187729 [bioreactor metagenome]|uniref:Uncharacterized protein n=1 Tax=bioreactor metagenome TaxID=1076179 RepID=A0A645HY08_9ZZZZ
MEGIDQLLDGFRAKGVASLGPVDGYLGDTLGSFVKNVRVSVGALPADACRHDSAVGCNEPKYSVGRLLPI